MTDDRTPTHPGGVIDEGERAKGWKLGNAASWKAVRAAYLGAKYEPGSIALFRRQGMLKALEAIEALGNAGPPADLGARR